MTGDSPRLRLLAAQTELHALAGHFQASDTPPSPEVALLLAYVGALLTAARVELKSRPVHGAATLAEARWTLTVAVALAFGEGVVSGPQAGAELAGWSR